MIFLTGRIMVVYMTVSEQKNSKKSDESLYNVSKRIINEIKWKKN